MNKTLKAMSAGTRDALKYENLRYFLYAVAIFVLLIVVLYQSLYGVATDLLVALEADEGWIPWIASVALHALLGTLSYFLIAPMILVIVSLFTERIVNNIHRDRYPDHPIATGSGSIKLAVATLRALGRYLLLMVVASPLLLVVGMGHLIFFLIGFLLFRRLLMIDVMGSMVTTEEVRERSSLSGERRYLVSTWLLYLLTMIPLVNLFVPYLAVCVLANEVMGDGRGEQ